MPDGLKRRFMRMNFDRKMRLFTFLAIGITALIILVSSTVSYISVSSASSEGLIQSQVSAISESFANAFKGYKDISIAVMLDKSIQRSLKDDPGSHGYYEYRLGAWQFFGNMMNIQPNINFVAVVKPDGKSLDPAGLYSGGSSLSDSQFFEYYQNDLAGSREVGTMLVNFQSAYYDGDPYAISIYHNIYDTSRLNRVIGQLCLSVSEPMLRQVLQGQDAMPGYRLFLADGDGKAVLPHDAELQAVSFSGVSGAIRSDGQLIIYDKIGDWGYYVVSIIPSFMLYQAGMPTVMALVAVIVVLALLSMIIGARIVKHSYAAMEMIVECMDAVSGGSMEARMSERVTGDDFIRIALGFNKMMNRLKDLLAQVKEEQHQIEQIRLNALHSQINPHFLYNTLDCIHWQAAMDGNKRISTLVKELASYYRLCLSKGHDVISLQQELSHVKSYFSLQNMRYGDIIAYDIDVAKPFGRVMIPKISLQPLVENSIYHGIRVKDGQPGHIGISARGDDEDVIISIEDDGNGIPQTRIDEMNALISVHDESFGYGVRNVHKRIELTFGKGYGLSYRAKDGGGLVVDIRLPWGNDEP
ncbi:MAG: sensor histidine kinase [Clostridiales bacterium]|jgi:two-component system sensor histidine kinase YesM|nr:sensor histidine kinase [Clostridiales bacterium]